MALDPDFVARLAAARRAPHGAAPEGCPDPAELAALIEGQVAEAARPDLERHLTLCEPCLATVIALDAEQAHAEETAGTGPVPLRMAPAARRGGARGAFAAAAVALLSVGAYVLFAGRDGPERDGSERNGSERDHVELAVAELSRADARLGASVAELTATELAALAPQTLRGAFRVLRPQGRGVGSRPALRVEPVAGATGYDVTVSDPLGVAVASFRLKTADTPWPADQGPLPAGPATEYVIKFEAQGVAGRVRALSAFHTAGPEELAAESAAAAAIAAEARAGAAALLRARRALRGGAYETAERALLEALNDPATAAPARVLLELLAKRLGPPLAR